MFQSGQRRRTPGGVYFKLLRDAKINDEYLDIIFDKSRDKYHEKRKIWKYVRFWKNVYHMSYTCTTNVRSMMRAAALGYNILLV